MRRALASVLAVAGVAIATLAATVVRGEPAPPVTYVPVVVVATIRVAPALVRATMPAAVRRSMRARPGIPVPVTITMYCLQGITRRGHEVREGILAADPRVFPLGRHVELNVGRRLRGRYLVDDTGRLVTDSIVDVWTASCDDAIRFGRRRGTATLLKR